MEANDQEATKGADSTEEWETVHVTPLNAERELSDIAVSRCFLLHAATPASPPFRSSLRVASASDSPFTSLPFPPRSALAAFGSALERLEAQTTQQPEREAEAPIQTAFDDSVANFTRTIGEGAAVYRRLRVIHCTAPCAIRCAVEGPAVAAHGAPSLSAGGGVATAANSHTVTAAAATASTGTAPMNANQSNTAANASAVSGLPPLVMLHPAPAAATGPFASAHLQTSLHSLLEAATGEGNASTSVGNGTGASPAPLGASLAATIPSSSLHGRSSVLHHTSKTSSRRSRQSSTLFPDRVVFVDPVDIVAEAEVSFVDIHFASAVSVRGRGPVQFINCRFSSLSVLERCQLFMAQPISTAETRDSGGRGGASPVHGEGVGAGASRATRRGRAAAPSNTEKEEKCERGGGTACPVGIRGLAQGYTAPAVMEALCARRRASATARAKEKTHDAAATVHSQGSSTSVLSTCDMGAGVAALTVHEEAMCMLSQCDVHGGASGVGISCEETSRVNVIDSSFDGPSMTWAAIEASEKAELTLQYVNIRNVLGVGLLLLGSSRVTVDSSVIERCGVAAVVATESVALALQNTGVEASDSGLCVSLSGSVVAQMVGCEFVTRSPLPQRAIALAFLERMQTLKAGGSAQPGAHTGPLQDPVTASTMEKLLAHTLLADISAMLGLWLLHTGVMDMSFPTASQSVVLTDRAVATMGECELTCTTQPPAVSGANQEEATTSEDSPGPVSGRGTRHARDGDPADGSSSSSGSHGGRSEFGVPPFTGLLSAAASVAAPGMVSKHGSLYHGASTSRRLPGVIEEPGKREAAAAAASTAEERGAWLPVGPLRSGTRLPSAAGGPASATAAAVALFPIPSSSARLSAPVRRVAAGVLSTYLLARDAISEHVRDCRRQHAYAHGWTSEDNAEAHIGGLPIHKSGDSFDHPVCFFSFEPNDGYPETEEELSGAVDNSSNSAYVHRLSALSTVAVETLAESGERLGCLRTLLSPHGGVYHLVLSAHASMVLSSSVLSLAMPPQLTVTLPWASAAGGYSNAGAFSSTMRVTAAPFVAAMLDYRPSPDSVLRHGGSTLARRESTGDSQLDLNHPQHPPRKHAVYCSLVTQSNVLRYECASSCQPAEGTDALPSNQPASKTEGGTVGHKEKDAETEEADREGASSVHSLIGAGLSTRSHSNTNSNKRQQPVEGNAVEGGKMMAPHSLVTAVPTSLAAVAGQGANPSLYGVSTTSGVVDFNTVAWGLVLLTPAQTRLPSAMEATVRLQAEHWGRVELAAVAQETDEEQSGADVEAAERSGDPAVPERRHLGNIFLNMASQSELLSVTHPEHICTMFANFSRIMELPVALEYQATSVARTSSDTPSTLPPTPTCSPVALTMPTLSQPPSPTSGQAHTHSHPQLDSIGGQSGATTDTTAAHAVGAGETHSTHTTLAPTVGHSGTNSTPHPWPSTASADRESSRLLVAAEMQRQLLLNDVDAPPLWAAAVVAVRDGVANSVCHPKVDPNGGLPRPTGTMVAAAAASDKEGSLREGGALPLAPNTYPSTASGGGASSVSSTSNEQRMRSPTAVRFSDFSSSPQQQSTESNSEDEMPMLARTRPRLASVAVLSRVGSSRPASSTAEERERGKEVMKIPVEETHAPPRMVSPPSLDFIEVDTVSFSSSGSSSVTSISDDGDDGDSELMHSASAMGQRRDSHTPPESQQPRGVLSQAPELDADGFVAVISEGSGSTASTASSGASMRDSGGSTGAQRAALASPVSASTRATPSAPSPAFTQETTPDTPGMITDTPPPPAPPAPHTTAAAGLTRLSATTTTTNNNTLPTFELSTPITESGVSTGHGSYDAPLVDCMSQTPTPSPSASSAPGSSRTADNFASHSALYSVTHPQPPQQPQIVHRQPQTSQQQPRNWCQSPRAVEAGDSSPHRTSRSSFADTPAPHLSFSASSRQDTSARQRMRGSRSRRSLSVAGDENSSDGGRTVTTLGGGCSIVDDESHERMLQCEEQIAQLQQVVLQQHEQLARMKSVVHRARRRRPDPAASGGSGGTAETEVRTAVPPLSPRPLSSLPVVTGTAQWEALETRDTEPGMRNEATATTTTTASTAVPTDADAVVTVQVEAMLPAPTIASPPVSSFPSPPIPTRSPPSSPLLLPPPAESLGLAGHQAEAPPTPPLAASPPSVADTAASGQRQTPLSLDTATPDATVNCQEPSYTTRASASVTEASSAHASERPQKRTRPDDASVAKDNNSSTGFFHEVAEVPWRPSNASSAVGVSGMARTSEPHRPSRPSSSRFTHRPSPARVFTGATRYGSMSTSATATPPTPHPPLRVYGSAASAMNHMLSAAHQGLLGDAFCPPPLFPPKRESSSATSVAPDAREGDQEQSQERTELACDVRPFADRREPHPVVAYTPPQPYQDLLQRLWGQQRRGHAVGSTFKENRSPQPYDAASIAREVWTDEADTTQLSESEDGREDEEQQDTEEEDAAPMRSFSTERDGGFATEVGVWTRQGCPPQPPPVAYEPWRTTVATGTRYAHQLQPHPYSLATRPVPPPQRCFRETIRIAGVYGDERSHESLSTLSGLPVPHHLPMPVPPPTSVPGVSAGTSLLRDYVGFRRRSSLAQRPQSALEMEETYGVEHAHPPPPLRQEHHASALPPSLALYITGGRRSSTTHRRSSTSLASTAPPTPLMHASSNNVTATSAAAASAPEARLYEEHVHDKYATTAWRAIVAEATSREREMARLTGAEETEQVRRLYTQPMLEKAKRAVAEAQHPHQNLRSTYGCTFTPKINGRRPSHRSIEPRRRQTGTGSNSNSSGRRATPSLFPRTLSAATAAAPALRRRPIAIEAMDEGSTSLPSTNTMPLTNSTGSEAVTKKGSRIRVGPPPLELRPPGGRSFRRAPARH